MSDKKGQIPRYRKFKNELWPKHYSKSHADGPAQKNITAKEKIIRVKSTRPGFVFYGLCKWYHEWFCHAEPQL